MKARYLVETELELFVDISPVSAHGCQPQAQATPVLDLLAGRILQLTCKSIATSVLCAWTLYSDSTVPPSYWPECGICLIALKLRKKLKIL